MRAVPKSIANESSALDVVDVAHTDASPQDAALSEWRSVENP